MSDYAFEPVFMPTKGRALVERWSTYWPLLHNKSLRPVSVEADLLEILSRWRYRLTELEKVNWEGIRNKLHMRLMRNCTPAGYGTMALNVPPDHTPWRCNNDTFCPWCWARKAGDIYTRFTDVVPKLTEGGEPWSMYTFSSKYKAKAGGWGDNHLRAVLRDSHAEWGSFAKRSGAHASYRITTLMPKESNDPLNVLGVEHPGYWEFRRAMVMVFKPGASPKVKLPVSKGILGSQRVTRAQLRVAVARCCAYPAGLLFADVGRTVKVLAARKGLRLSEGSGALRS